MTPAIYNMFMVLVLPVLEAMVGVGLVKTDYLQVNWSKLNMTHISNRVPYNVTNADSIYTTCIYDDSIDTCTMLYHTYDNILMKHVDTVEETDIYKGALLTSKYVFIENTPQISISDLLPNHPAALVKAILAAHHQLHINNIAWVMSENREDTCTSTINLLQQHNVTTLTTNVIISNKMYTKHIPTLWCNNILVLCMTTDELEPFLYFNPPNFNCSLVFTSDPIQMSKYGEDISDEVDSIDSIDNIQYQSLYTHTVLYPYTYQTLLTNYELAQCGLFFLLNDKTIFLEDDKLTSKCYTVIKNYQTRNVLPFLVGANGAFIEMTDAPDWTGAAQGLILIKNVSNTMHDAHDVNNTNNTTTTTDTNQQSHTHVFKIVFRWIITILSFIFIGMYKYMNINLYKDNKDCTTHKEQEHENDLYLYSIFANVAFCFISLLLIAIGFSISG
jgi:hypothetical protein